MLALILALTLLQPTPTPSSLPPSPPKAPQPAGGPAGTQTTPTTVPLAARPPVFSPSTDAIDRLSPSDRRAVEAAAPFYFRFEDGTTWSRQVEAQMLKLPKGSPILAAYQQGDAPLWSDITHSATARSEDEVYAWLDTADINAQAEAQGLKTFAEFKVLQITPEGALIDAGDELYRVFYLTGWKGQAKAVDNDLIRSTIHVKHAGRHQYTSAGGALNTVEHYQAQYPTSRVKHTKTPIPAAVLADLLESGAIPGLTTWSPIKADNRAAAELSRHSPATAKQLLAYTWKPRTTKLKFKPAD